MIKTNKLTKAICALLVGATVVTASPFTAFAKNVEGKIVYICTKGMCHEFENVKTSHKKDKFSDDLIANGDYSHVFNSNGWDSINSAKYKAVMSTTLAASDYVKSKKVQVTKGKKYAEVPKEASTGTYVLAATNDAQYINVRVYVDGEYQESRDIDQAVRNYISWRAVKK